MSEIETPPGDETPAPAEQPEKTEQVEASPDTEEAPQGEEAPVVKDEQAEQTEQAEQAAQPEGEAPPEGEEKPEEGDKEPDQEEPSHAPELPTEEMSFAEMFELAEKQSEKKRPKAKGGRREKSEHRPGQVINSRVVGFSHDSVFLDVGAKAEGVIAKSELENDAGELTVVEGDIVEARVRKIDGGTVILSKVLPHQSIRNRESVGEAYRAHIPIEGRVTGQNKGGFDVDVSGLRAFCPASQIDFRPGKGENYIGEKFTFKIVEFKDGGRNIVVSRRSILQEERKKKAEEVLKTLDVGSKVTGLVTTLKDYGAFIDLGGVEGLVHLSEISHKHINKPHHALKIDQEVEAQVLKIEEGKEGTKKISLSIKALSRDPWEEAKETITEGQKVIGKVQRLQSFGAFVEILPGVDGLIHVSNMAMGARVRDPREVVNEGDEVEATVISVDWEKRRIGLSLVKSKQELAGELTQAKVYEGTIDRIESFGLFVKLPTGARGLVPAAETGTQRGADLKKEFSHGAKVKVTVLDADKKSGKIRLSIRAAVEAEERAEYAGYLNTTTKGSGLGTLGDLFKNKFGDKLGKQD